MSTFDPRRHPRGLDGRFAPAPPPEDPDVGLAADLADPRPASCLATVVLPADPEERAELASRWPPAAPEVLAALVDDTDHGWGIAVAAARNTATPRDASDPRLDRWGSLRARWEQAEADARQASDQMDTLLAEMCAERPVTHVASDVGLSRQEVHRRIARARAAG